MIQEHSSVILVKRPLSCKSNGRETFLASNPEIKHRYTFIRKTYVKLKDANDVKIERTQSLLLSKLEIKTLFWHIVMKAKTHSPWEYLIINNEFLMVKIHQIWSDYQCYLPFKFIGDFWGWEKVFMRIFPIGHFMKIYNFKIVWLFDSWRRHYVPTSFSIRNFFVCLGTLGPRL